MHQTLNIVLVEPVIPQNTGAIARLCACTGTILHLIHPLGFKTDEASVKRAGLDYWEHVTVKEHANWEAFVKAEKPKTLFFFSKFAQKSYTKAEYQRDSYLIFGNETKGLSKTLHEQYSKDFFQIPMFTHIVRSLNLSQSAAVITYEALRQTNMLSEIESEADKKFVEYAQGQNFSEIHGE